VRTYDHDVTRTSSSWLADKPVAGYVTLAAAVAFGVVGFLGEEAVREPCSVASPCEPEPIGFTSLGLLLATVVAAFIHRGATRLLSVLFLGVYVTAVRTELPSTWWSEAAAVAFVVICWWVTSRPRRGVTGLLREPVVSTSPVRTVAPPPPVRRDWAWAAGGAVVAAVALGVAFVVVQSAADEREASARVLAGMVDARYADSVGVALPDGTDVLISVLEPADYEVGSELALYVDDRGVIGPVSEPTDRSWLLVFGGFALGLTGIFGARAVDAGWAHRRYRNRTQPRRRCIALPLRFEVVVMSSQHDDPVLVVPTRLWEERDLARLWSTASPDGCAAWLYGDPHQGRWCEVEVNGRVIPSAGVVTLRPRGQELPEVIELLSHLEVVVEDPAAVERLGRVIDRYGTEVPDVLVNTVHRFRPEREMEAIRAKLSETTPAEIVRLCEVAQRFVAAQALLEDLTQQEVTDPATWEGFVAGVIPGFEAEMAALPELGSIDASENDLFTGVELLGLISVITYGVGVGSSQGTDADLSERAWDLAEQADERFRQAQSAWHDAWEAQNIERQRDGDASKGRWWVVAAGVGGVLVSVVLPRVLGG
jgi:hypothetical protein